MTTALVAFLRDRLVDVERNADDVHDITVCDTVSRFGGLTGPCDCGWPAFVLADVAAKRRIIDICQDAADEASGLVAADEIGARLTTEFFGIAVLRHLAQPYATHPDFDPAWSVSAGVR